ncbi:MAG: RHS repeat protein, partial [Aquabacterium sp.]
MKDQPETDYTSPNGLLEFTRRYRSDMGGFSSIASAAGFVNNATDDAKGNCLMSSWVLQGVKQAYCFPLLGTGQATADLWTSSGKRISFGLDASGQPVAPVNVNERAVRLTDTQGVVTWLVKRDDSAQEIYSASGLLLSRTNVDGKKLTFVYSDSSTATSVAPRAGLLITMKDPFGRALNFQYNEWGVVSKMIDPNGQIYSYAYGAAGIPCVSGYCEQVTYPGGFVRQ